MIRVSSSEASLLALVAENPKLPDAELDVLVAPMKPEVQALARAIVQVAKGDAAPAELEASAKGMLEWASANRKQRRAVTA